MIFGCECLNHFCQRLCPLVRDQPIWAHILHLAQTPMSDIIFSYFLCITRNLQPFYHRGERNKMCLCACVYALKDQGYALVYLWMALCIQIHFIVTNMRAGVCKRGFWYFVSWSHLYKTMYQWKGRRWKCQTIIWYQWCSWSIHLHICMVKWNMRLGVSPHSKNRTE